jgi:uncharacterized protein YjbJ (UPF0337 family)
MNKDELHGKAENLKGRAKEAAGALTGNKQKQAEGLVERVGGAVREEIGKAKGEVKRSAETDDEKSRDDE